MPSERRAEEEVDQAMDDVKTAASALAGEQVLAQPVEFSSFEGAEREREQDKPKAAAEASINLKLLMDVSIPITVEVGRAEMSLNEIVQLGPGSIVGEMALIGHRPRNASVVAQSPMRLLSFDIAAFKRLLDEMPVARDYIFGLLRARAEENRDR